MRFVSRTVPTKPKLDELVADRWFVTQISEHANGKFEILLSHVSQAGGLLSITLRARPPFDVREFLADCIDYDRLRDLGADSHSPSTVGQGGAAVDG